MTKIQSIEALKRFREGKYDKEEIVHMFMEILDTIDEFVIVAQATTVEGESTTEILCTTSNTAEVIGMLEMGKLNVFENRFE